MLYSVGLTLLRDSLGHIYQAPVMLPKSQGAIERQ